MADASKVFQILVPAGNNAVVLSTRLTPLVPCNVRRILITWPYGCAGQVNVRINAGGGFAFPSDVNGFMSFDDYTYVIDVTGQTDSGQWSVVTYNTDVIDHMVQVVYEYDYLRNQVDVSQQQPIAL